MAAEALISGISAFILASEAVEMAAGACIRAIELPAMATRPCFLSLETKFTMLKPVGARFAAGEGSAATVA